MIPIPTGNSNLVFNGMGDLLSYLKPHNWCKFEVVGVDNYKIGEPTSGQPYVVASPTFKKSSYIIYCHILTDGGELYSMANYRVVPPDITITKYDKYRILEEIKKLVNEATRNEQYANAI